jgi:hypothetical protein
MDYRLAIAVLLLFASGWCANNAIIIWKFVRVQESMTFKRYLEDKLVAVWLLSLFLFILGIYLLLPVQP